MLDADCWAAARALRSACRISHGVEAICEERVQLWGLEIRTREVKGTGGLGVLFVWWLKCPPCSMGGVPCGCI